MKKIKKDQLLTLKQVENIIFDTPKRRQEFERYYKRFVEENRREVLQELGTQIRRARNKAGVSQKELAKRLNTSSTTISRVEHGDQNLTVEYIVKVATALGRPFEIKIY